MMSLPCYSVNLPGVTNTLVAELRRGETVQYKDMNTKQTSRCGSNQDPPGKTLCWIQATAPSGAEGWVPAVRGSFTDAFCNTEASSPAESLLVNPCGEREPQPNMHVSPRPEWHVLCAWQLDGSWVWWVADDTHTHTHKHTNTHTRTHTYTHTHTHTHTHTALKGSGLTSSSTAVRLPTGGLQFAILPIA